MPLPSLCYNLAIMFKQFQSTDLIVEKVGDETYEYYPLGQHIVIAPGVCGGRPTFKYTRLEVRVILWYLAEGSSISEVLHNYQQSNISREAVLEAIELANTALQQATIDLVPIAT